VRGLRRRTCRSRDGEAGDSLIRDVPGGWEQPRQRRDVSARPDGAVLGKRDEEEYARNQRDYVPGKVNRRGVLLRAPD
jgi:hypothetical protein